MATVDETSFSDTGLTAETEYSYVVKAYNANGISAESAPVTATTQAAAGATPTPRAGGNASDRSDAGPQGPVIEDTVAVEEPAQAPQASVTLKTRKSRGVLRVNVNPNQGSDFWKVRVQRLKKSGDWTQGKVYRTKGKKEVRTINRKAGTYRVIVKAKFGYERAKSRSVRLTW